MHNSGNTVTISTSTTNAFIPYSVTTTSVAATLTNVTLSGDEILSTTGGHDYSASGTYTSASTNYHFNNADHFIPARTTETITPTCTWTVSGTGASYVSIDSNTGTVTVNSIPTDGDKTITLRCVPSYNGTTGTAVTKTITLKAVCATPTFSFNNTNNQVTLSTTTAGATIYYTTNGSTPTTSSNVYTGPFEQSSAATIKAIAVKDGVTDSEVGVFNVEKLATPHAEYSGGRVTFSSGDDGVTFYYNYYNVDQNETDPGTPTSSSSSWTTGSTGVSIPADRLIQVITMKAPTATTGYINSNVYRRRANTTDMSERNYVFMYDDGTTVHFMANNGGTIADATTFNPSSVIWEGLPFANPDESLKSIGLYYEPFIRFRNNGRYLAVWPKGCEEEFAGTWSDNLSLTFAPVDSMYFFSRGVNGRGTLINASYYFSESCLVPMPPNNYPFWFITFGYNTTTNRWERNNTKGAGYGYENDFFTVTYPVEELGGGNYLLNVVYPANYETQKEEVNKGQSVTINASITGPDGTGTGTYGLPYYRVGNEVKFFYYYANSSTPMTSEPTPSNDIRITYELLNGTDYLEVDDATHTYALVKDPGRDLYVTVRVTATPYIDGVEQPDGVQVKDYQFHILTSPPFPAPVISRVEGTNNYQMECSASNAIIEYKIDGAAACAACGDIESSTHPGWCVYDGPITITTPGTIITARSYRASDNSLSDPVDYKVGGAMLLPPTITISNGGSVTLAANPDNASIEGYTGTETFYYTTDGSEPDPDNVGAVTKQYTGAFTVTNGQEIKAVATLTGFTNSAISHDTYKVASGTSSYGVVTLNDYEDHNWSYYQASADLPTGYPDQMHSPYPRNVQITYYGYGEDNLSTANAAAPAASTFTETTTPADVKVGIGEEGHTFLYYKTLERDANGRYPYELIPNPFYVRPAVTTYSGTKTLRLVMNDAGGDGWASHLQVNFSDGSATKNYQLESGSTKTETFTVNSGVTVTLSWVVGGGKNNECSFTLSYDGGSTIYESGLDPQSGNLKVFKVEGTYTVSSYTGFYKWRIKSITDGAIYTASTGGTALAVNDMVDAETTYYFQPSDAGETNANNATSMKVELEAMWARAEIYNNGFSNGYNSVERNFYITSGGSSTSLTSNLGAPCTYTSFYPNGTTNGTTSATLADRKTNRANFTPTYASKIEYINLNRYQNGDGINAYGMNLTIGRGVDVTSSTKIPVVGSASRVAMNQRLRIESGQYTTFTSYTTNNPTSITRHWVVLGSDYDRAKGDNSKLTFSGRFLTAEGRNLGLSSTGEMARVWSKSGSFMTGVAVSNAAAENSYYIGVTNTHNNGHRYLEIEGGEWYANIAGGMGENHTATAPGFTFRMRGGIIRGSVYGAAAFAGAGGTRKYIITGGTIRGWVAGGANGTQSDGGLLDGATHIYVGGNARIDSNGSNAVINRGVGGNVFGAGCGYNGTSNSGQISLGTNVAIADNAYVERGVYGGGAYGFTEATSNIYILGGTVDGKVGGVNGTTYSANITGGVFGGACQNRGGTVNIYMTGGQVNGGLYGGSNATGNIANDVTMYINGGQVGADAEHIGYVHGGGLGNATRVLGSVNMTIGESVGATKHVTIYGDVYGGSAQGRTNGNNSRTADAETNVTMNAGKIHGSLYGGGLGTNDYAAHVYGPVQVTVNGGGIHATHQDGSGAVYGCNNVNGAPQSTVYVDIYGTDAPADGREYALDAVYGGGNKATYAGTPVVKIHNCDNRIEYVYGGGNAANVNGTNVTIYGGNVIGTVFGGGNGSVSAANVNGNVVLGIYGGTIRQVFGGNNASGDITGSIAINIDKKGDEDPKGSSSACDMRIGEVYGGGNMANSKAGSITIGCTGDYDDTQVLSATNRIGYELEGIGDVYGGANKADIDGNIRLDITGGVINRVFGANNNSGSIDGTITINVNKNKTCGWYVGDVFGGGNQAAYTAPTGNKDYPRINLTNGDISGDVYGGGYGDPVDKTKGTVDGNPRIYIIGSTVKGNVFGGGSMANLKGGVDIEVTGGGVEGDVYGGGALANTNTEGGNTVINLLGGSVHNVFGGGLGNEETAALVGGNVTVTLNGSVVTGNIFGCNNINGTPLGHVKVWVKKTVGWTGHDVSAGKADDSIAKTDQVYEVAAVYGGGNMAAYEPTNASTEYTEVLIDGCDLTSIGYVYGGGNAASVPATQVTVNGTYEIGNVFGGGNGKDDLPNGDPNPGADVGYLAGGTPYGAGTSKVVINGGTVHKAFGGSNTLGNVRTSATVNLDEVGSCPLEIDEVYGGGNEAYMAGGGNIVLGCISYLREIYGGAKNANVGSDVSLTITSGHFDRVFGGNNIGGDINGSITVNIEETGCNPITIGELYGCGNNAAYSTPSGKSDPTVNIKSFTSIGRVFGGGLGTSATVTGNPMVKINEIVGARATTASSYAGTTRTMPDGTTVALPTHESGKIGAIGTVFGGGNAAEVRGNTNVHIGTDSTISYVSGSDHAEKSVVGADIRGNVFGGGNEAAVTGNTDVAIGK